MKKEVKRVFKIMVIEDDFDNVELLKLFLNQINESVSLVAVARSFKDIPLCFSKFAPDIILSDIQLEDGLIFDVLDFMNLGNSQLIFTSAHASYGVKAIKYQPIGYLVKPFDFADLEFLLKKAIFNLNTKEQIGHEHFVFNPNHQIAISSMDRIDLVNLEKILYVEADGRYSHFYLTDGKITASKNLGSYESELVQNNFYRIHSKYLINLRFLKSIHKDGGSYCVLENNVDLPIARRRLEKFLKLFMK